MDRSDHSRDSWPPTPGSPRPGSFYHATTTVDDLTLALTNYSRVPSPEPSPPPTCCCGSEDCEHTKSWLSFKSKLESRLILSAEVGQALLQKYEAYVHRHESELRRQPSQDTQVDSPVDHVDSRVAELVKENGFLQKRLAQALLDNEVSDSSHKTVLQELEEARASVSRLAAHHARAVGLDSRLMAVMREKDDIQQERDSEAQRAKIAESRIAALKERTSKLQSEVRRLEHGLEQRRQHRLELSEEILHDARSRLQTLQNYQLGRGTMAEDAEVMKVLESLVADNENLKHDNAELQQLLTETREDLRALQEEVEEHRAAVPSAVDTPYSASRQYYPGSIPSSFKDQSVLHSSRRTVSVEPKSRRGYPLTPETDRRPLSPVDSLMPPDMKHTSFNHPQPRYPSSHVSSEADHDRQFDNVSPSPQKGLPHKSLSLLNQSRGVQTDDWTGFLAPSPIPPSFTEQLSNLTPPDGQSESSSVLDSNSSHIGIVLDRISTLLTRLTQADALTLTNRLKRQNLKGADVGHLSRTTVTSILNETVQLRAQFRSILEDDKFPVSCTRKDLRGLFKLFREFFSEMGQLRITLNDVILDPSIAWKVSEMALDPAKAAERERQAAKGYSWIAPLAKLFGAPNVPSEPNPTVRDATSPARAMSRGRDRTPARKAPKLGPALAATTTTVNVEFSGSGVGRSVTNTSSAAAPRQDEVTSRTTSSTVPPPPPPAQASFMNIFAGAPRPAESWVVLPKDPRRGPLTRLNGETFGATATIGRSTMADARNAARMSQNVDAVIDSRDPHGPENVSDDAFAPLFQRTLRRRGLSDSSIHSTFMTQAEEPQPLSGRDGLFVAGAWPDKSVLRSFSRKVQQSFRSAATGTLSGFTAEGSTPGPGTLAALPSSPSSIGDVLIESAKVTSTPSQPRTASPISLLPHMASWTAAATALEPGGLGTDSPFGMGSPRDDVMHRTWGREAHGRDF